MTADRSVAFNRNLHVHNRNKLDAELVSFAVDLDLTTYCMVYVVLSLKPLVASSSG